MVFYGFMLLLLLLEITSLVFTRRKDLACQRPNSVRLVIVAKGFLILPNVPMLMEQDTLLPSRNLEGSLENRLVLNNKGKERKMGFT